MVGILTSVNEENDEVYVPEINRMLNEVSMGMILGVGINMIFRRSLLGRFMFSRNYRGAFSANDRAVLTSLPTKLRCGAQCPPCNQTPGTIPALGGAARLSCGWHPDPQAPNLTVERMNRSLEHMLQIKEEACIGKPIQEVLVEQARRKAHA